MDLIRFLAAFAVLASHYRGAFFVDYSSLPAGQQNPLMFCFYSITRLGHEAVLIFFILSGFLVGGKALDRIFRHSFNPLSYSIDRAVRIMLPLISSLLLFLPIALYTGCKINVLDWIGNLLSLQGILCWPAINVLWSLSYEVWFYIMMCSFGYIVMYRGRKKSYLGFIVLLISFLVFTKLHTFYLFIWLFGAMGYFIIPQRSKTMMIVMLFLSIILLMALQLTSGSKFSGVEGELGSMRKCLEIVFSAAFACFIIQMIQYAPTHRWNIMLNKLGTKLAAFSYTLYLTHIPVQILLEHFGAPKSKSICIASVMLYILWLAIAMVSAYGIYYVFERNTSTVKEYIKRYMKQ